MGGVNNIDWSTVDVQSTAISLATGTSPTMPKAAQGCVITVSKNKLMMRDDGTAPTATVGHPLEDGDVITLDSWSVPRNNWRQVMARMQFIQAVAATTGTINVSWYD